jgi:hypothetical protein
MLPEAKSRRICPNNSGTENDEDIQRIESLKIFGGNSFALLSTRMTIGVRWVPELRVDYHQALTSTTLL